MIDSTFEGIVTTVTSQIEQALGLAFHISKMPLNIKVTTANGDRRDVLGVYAFSHGKGLRFDFDEQTGDLLEIAVWTGPGDLEVPDLRVQGMDQVEMIINALRSETPIMEESSKLLEGARDDVNAYLNTLGVEAENQKIAQLYRGYFEWAGQRGKNPVSNARFRTLANEWFEGGEESQSAPEQKDEIVVSPEEQAEFDDIMQNEVFYTTKLMESSVRRIAHSDPGIVALFICGGPGLGKASWNHSKVATPSGWKETGSLKKGDYVLTPKGTKAEILDIYPQGLSEIFEIELSDGSKTWVTEDHLWRVKRMDRSISRTKIPFLGNKRREDILSTKKMLELGLQNAQGKWRFAVPFIEKPIEFDCQSELPIDPYVLGLLLGDGCFTELTSTKNALYFATKDQFLVDEINKRVEKYNCKISSSDLNQINYYFSRIDSKKENILAKRLVDLGLGQKDSSSKFIPEIYLNASSSNRLELLRGLIDTDGWITKLPSKKNEDWKDFGVTQFYSISKQLTEGVAYLVRSLGGQCSYKLKPSRYKDIDGRIIECADHYRMTISMGAYLENIAKLPRKASLYTSTGGDSRTIRSITPVFKDEATCIMIDDPDHLYITDDCIVTHNTFTVKQILKEEGVWDAEVIYKSGSIAGFTGLRQLLWDYRKGKIIVLDDNDSILAVPAAANLLKAALNGDPEARIVSYTKARRR